MGKKNTLTNLRVKKQDQEVVLIVLRFTQRQRQDINRAEGYTGAKMRY